MIKACVIGSPIAHSRSPLIHNYWIKQNGINGHYEKVEVNPQHLEGFFDRLRHGTYAGANVTIPHKETAVRLIDDADDRVRRIGALNTVWRNGETLCATSTDGPGFVANVITHCPDFSFNGKSVTILGAGGSTRALVDELLRQGAERIQIFNRTHARAQHLAEHFGKGVLAVHPEHMSAILLQTDLLVNTTSQGMNSDTPIDITWSNLKPTAVVADIVYTPLITAFLKIAASRDHVIVPGLGMLLHQAVIGFEKWFGVLPKVTPELYHMIARDIDPEYGQ